MKKQNFTIVRSVRGGLEAQSRVRDAKVLIVGLRGVHTRYVIARLRRRAVEIKRNSLQQKNRYAKILCWVESV